MPMKIGSLLAVSLGCFTATAGSAQEAMTVDFVWPRFDRCSISSMPSPAFTLKGVPPATIRLSLALTKDEDRRELGGQTLFTRLG